MRRRRTTAADTEATSDTEQTVSENANESRAEDDLTQTVPAPEAADGEATETEAPRRRRTTRTRKKTEEPAGGGAIAAPTDEATAPALEAAAPPPADAAEEEAPAKPKRTRRRSAKTAEASAEAAPVEAAPEAAPAPVAAEAPAEAQAADAPEEAPSEAPARPARRRGRKSASAASTEESAATSTEAAPAPASAETPAADASAPAESPARQRVRGRRRTGATPSPALTGTETAVAPAAPTAPTAPIAPVVVAAEGAAEEIEAEAKPKRVRGVRRPRAAAAAETTTAPAYSALPAETLSRLAETRIALRKGVAELVVQGEPQLPYWFFVNTDDPESRETAARQIRLAYNAGVRFFTVMAHLPWMSRGGERRYEPLDEALQFVAAHAPEGFILPRLIFSPPLSWERNHPDEMTLYADGETGDVSLASHSFWEEEADAALRAAVEHVAQGPLAGRVFGFYLEHGEWFHDAARGYDISPANQAAFRSWLRTRYQNDVVALRASWHDGKVEFETAEIPPYRPADGVAPTAPLFFQERERRYADFHEYSSDIVAQVVTHLGRAIKESSGGRSAVAVSYGYTLELARAGSGHLSLARVLDSPYIDILTGPISYSGRLPGGSAPLPAPTASIALAGKLWVSEDDTKTFLAQDETPDTYNPRIESARETGVVQARNFGAALSQNVGLSWMDLWGTGWLDDPAIWESLGRLREHADRLATRRRNPRTRVAAGPDVAVIVDERSFFGVRGEQRLLKELVAQQRDNLLRTGARFGFYLLSDLTRKNFPDSARLLLFVNAFQLPTDVRAALRERFQGDGRTLAWLYGPGCLEAIQDAAGASELTDLVGMQLRLQAWGSRTGTVVTDGGSPLTHGMRGMRFGAEERTNPSFYVSDPRAQILGEYAGTGNASLAVRRHPAWQSVFIGETSLPVRLLRNLCRLAGVPTYTTEEDVSWIGDSLICLHSTEGGLNTIALPEEGAIHDLLSGETLTSGGYGVQLQLMPGEVRLLFHGTPAEVIRLGGNPQAAPPGMSAEELPPPPTAFVVEPGAARADVSSDDERIMAAALADEERIVDKDAEGTDEGDEDESGAETGDADSGGKKRKRRRRRRGRGTDAETDEPAASLLVPLPEPEAAEPAAAPRTLPSLEELLPDSEAPYADLPIPDEILPLPGELGETDLEAEGAVGAIDAAEENGSPLRRRRRRSRRGRGGRGEAESAATPTEMDAPPADEPDVPSEEIDALPVDESPVMEDEPFVESLGPAEEPLGDAEPAETAEVPPAEDESLPGDEEPADEATEPAEESAVSGETGETEPQP